MPSAFTDGADTYIGYFDGMSAREVSHLVAHEWVHNHQSFARLFSGQASRADLEAYKAARAKVIAAKGMTENLTNAEYEEEMLCDLWGSYIETIITSNPSDLDVYGLTETLVNKHSASFSAALESNPEVDYTDASETAQVAMGLKPPTYRFSVNANRIEYSQQEIHDNCVALQRMNSVSDLTGKEFPKGETPLREQVLLFFERNGNVVYSEQFGDVSLSVSSWRSEQRHGLTNRKAISFAAIPTVIQRGVVIDAKKYKSGQYERVVVAAPITIAGIPYYMGVMLQRDKQNQRLYLHDVVLKNQEVEAIHKTRLAAGSETESSVSRGSTPLDVSTILENAIEVKPGVFSSLSADDDVNTLNAEFTAALAAGDTETADRLYDELTRTVQDILEDVGVDVKDQTSYNRLLSRTASKLAKMLDVKESARPALKQRLIDAVDATVDSQSIDGFPVRELFDAFYSNTAGAVNASEDAYTEFRNAFPEMWAEIGRIARRTAQMNVDVGGKIMRSPIVVGARSERVQDESIVAARTALDLYQNDVTPGDYSQRVFHAIR